MGLDGSVGLWLREWANFRLKGIPNKGTKSDPI